MLPVENVDNSPHLLRPAIDAWSRGEFRGAVVLALDAAERFRRAGLEAGWFEATVEAATSQSVSGRELEAYATLLRALQHEPPDRPELSAATARVWAFFCSVNLAVGLDRVWDRYHDVERFAAGSAAVTASDLHHLRWWTLYLLDIPALAGGAT